MSTACQEVHSPIPYHSRSRLFWIGTGLMVLYYVADSAMDAWFFDEGTTALEQIFSPETHEIAIRLLSGTFLFIFFLFAKHILAKNQLLQQSLVIQSQQLMTASREREAFLYSLSHELRTTLTCIYTADQILLEKHTESLEPEARYQVEKIHEFSEKMAAQIDEMLDLSLAMRSSLEREQVSLNKILQEASQEILSVANDMTVSIEIENNMFAECDPILIRLAIRNLCQSAIHFSKPNRFAELVIGSEKREGTYTLFVRNKDVYLPEKETKKLFDFFDRLPKSENLAGVQLGLVLAETVIQRHGGQMWMESDATLGTSFHFTI